MIIPFERSEIYGSVYERFKHVVDVAPSQIAIESKAGTATYRELSKRADAIECGLQTKDASEFVMIYLENGINGIAAIFAALKHGSAFVILPFNSTSESRAEIWRQCGEPIVVTSLAYQPDLFEVCSSSKMILVEELELDQKIGLGVDGLNKSLNIATLLFTSGSTGAPKGVINSHKMVLHTAFINHKIYGFGTEDRVALFATFGYGAAITASFAVLLSGATLVLPSYNSAQELVEWIRQKHISVLSQLPASLYRQIFSIVSETGDRLNCRGLLVGGDPLYSADIQAFRACFNKNAFFDHRFAGSEFMLLFHSYITADSVIPVDNELIPFQTPIADKTTRILKADGTEAQAGQVGEIVVTSEFISSGYWADQKRTESVFDGPDEFGKMTYRSGDMGKLDEKGRLTFLGRGDRQIKIRGFSVNLDEIDHQTRKYAGVTDAFTIFNQTTRNQRLVTYYTTDQSINDAELRSWIRDRLPTYMMPTVMLKIDVFPRTRTGKILESELPAPRFQRPVLNSDFISPRSEKEAELVEIWQDVLEIDGIGIEDDFFELGGDSLTYLLLVTELEKAGYTRSNLSSTSGVTVREVLGSDAEQTKILPFEFSSKKVNKRTFRRVHLQPKVFFSSVARQLERLLLNAISVNFKDLDYFEANRKLAKFSRSWVARNLIFAYKRKAFFNWMKLYNYTGNQPDLVFGISIFNRISSTFARYLKYADENQKNLLDEYPKSPANYWRSYYSRVINTPREELPKLFSAVNLEILIKAHREGKGVILLSYHGGQRFQKFHFLESFFELDSIPVISYKIPLNDEANHGESILRTNSVILIQGYETLAKGGIIKIYPDTDEDSGQFHLIPMLHRRFHIKAGFAELSLRSGAPIIPVNFVIDMDGQAQMVFYPALTPVGEDHNAKISSLLEQYADFVNDSFARHPGSILWKKFEDLDKIPVSE